MQIESVNKLARFQNLIDGQLWRALWITIDPDPSMANHMWNKFAGHNHELLVSWANADGGNRRTILAMINKFWALHLENGDNYRRFMEAIKLNERYAKLYATSMSFRER